MAGTAGTRLNHYQLLDVSPSAGGDEIARAFARESSVFRPQLFGRLTEVCVAYETLRDPVKRRAYDASIGLDPGSKTPEPSRGLRGTATAEMMTRAAPVERRMPVAEPQPQSHQQPQPAISDSALPLGPGADPNIRPESSIGRGNPFPFPLADVLEAEVHPTDWRRAGIILGGIVIAACTFGGLAGWWSVSGIGEAAQPENEVSVPLSAAKNIAAPPGREIAVAPAIAPIAPRTRPDRPEPTPAVGRTEPTPSAPEPAESEARPELERVEPSLSTPIEDETSTVPTVAPEMPLPNRVIARTIDRIGYSCGSVASTTAVEGEAPGVFKVTCSSGQSYQAKPVNGRYRFRRWGKQ